MAKSDVKMRIIFFVAIVLVAGGVAEAALGTVNVAYTGHGAGRRLTFYGGGRSYQTHFGVYMLNKTGGTDKGAEWPNGPLGIFCIELTEYASTSTLTYNVVMPQDAQAPQTFLGGPVGLSKANYLRELWGRFFNPSWVGSGGHTTQQNNDAAAFGACVWEIVYENYQTPASNYDVTVDGLPSNPLGFRCSGNTTVTGIANNWLRALDGTGPKTDLRAFVRNGKQDYVTEWPTPEPATICLLGLGALRLLRRKRST